MPFATSIDVIPKVGEEIAGRGPQPTTEAWDFSPVGFFSRHPEPDARSAAVSKDLARSSARFGGAAGESAGALKPQVIAGHMLAPGA